MNNLVKLLNEGLKDKKIMYQPKAPGPKYWGTVKSISSRNVFIESEEKKILLSAPLDQVYIDADCIIIPSPLKS